MSKWPFRFIHAADLHLEMPPVGLADVPEHLEGLFLDAAYRAAARVFDAALAEEVDFLILSGDVLQCRQTGPRGPLFLVEQFRRLAQRNIAVHWAGGRIDPPDDWPAAIPLPENVHRFSQGKLDTWVFRRDDTPLVRLIGTSRGPKGRIEPSQFDPPEPGLFTIAVAHGKVAAEDLQSSQVDYWALGGRHSARTLCRVAPVAHYPGSPQGRRPDEDGPHGCALVKVDAQRNVEVSQVPTDVMRWHSERISIDAQTDRPALEEAMRGRIEALGGASGVGSSGDGDRLISWTVSGAGPLATPLRQGPLASEILDALRREYGMKSPVRWSVSLAVEPRAVPPAWREQETIRGDFLRLIDERRRHAEDAWGLESLLPADASEELLAAVSEPASRDAVLNEAAMLGVDLLSGEEPQS